MKKQRKRYYDKNRTRIKLGDKLDMPIRTKAFYKDCVVVEQDNQLGLIFICNNHFIPFSIQSEDFFKNCEIIKSNI